MVFTPCTFECWALAFAWLAFICEFALSRSNGDTEPGSLAASFNRSYFLFTGLRVGLRLYVLRVGRVKLRFHLGRFQNYQQLAFFNDRAPVNKQLLYKTIHFREQVNLVKRDQLPGQMRRA